jgi:branched-chain amino acid transport system permease protein
MPRLPRTVAVGALVALAAAVAAFPALLGEFRAFQFTLVGVYFIAILGLNILTGYTGQISLGHGAFMALGAYTTAILSVSYGVPDLATIPIAGLVAGIVGFAFGFPALRLAGVYLALATFALAVAVPALARGERFEHLTGGTGGLILDLPTSPIAGLSPSKWLYYVTWAVAGVLLVAAWLLLRGRTGRAFRAIRDSEIAAVSSGVSLARYKTIAFGVSAFYGGVAGGLYIISIAFVNPDTFPITLSILLLTGAVVAGLGSLVGVVVGALFIQFAPLWGQQISDQAPSVVYGAILLLVLLVAPAGAAGLLRKGLLLVTKPVYSRRTS